MTFFQKMRDHMANTFRVLTLADFRQNFSPKAKLQLAVTSILTIVNSVVKVLAPAALAKGVEMIVLEEKESTYGTITLNANHFFYFSIALTTWIKIDVFIKKILLKDLGENFTEQNILNLIESTHSLAMDEHSVKRSHVTQLLMDLVNTQSHVVNEIITVIYQAITDIAVGSILIYLRYGKIIGSEFLLYCALDFLLLNSLVDVLTKHSANFELVNKKLFKFINHEIETLNSVDTIRMFNHEQFEISQSTYLLRKFLEANSKFRISEDIATAIKIFPIIIANIIPVTLLLKPDASYKDVDDLVFLLGYINLFGSNVLNLSQSMKTCLRAVETFDKKIELSSRVTNRLQLNHTNLPFLTNLSANYPTPTIEFSNVSFAYPGSTQYTLKGISFTILPGSHVGIIGHSNAGKSTLVKLLYGIFKPTLGTIKINGHNLDEFPPALLSRIFCCVPQTADLFRDKSLKYNVLYGTDRDNLLEDYLRGKYHRCQVLEGNKITYDSINHQNIEGSAMNKPSTAGESNNIFSTAMKKVKLEELIGPQADAKNSASTLSGGQRQKVSIARAIARNSCIFVFDESTSNLDSFSEENVLKNIKEVTQNKTSIMITHRLSTVREADNIIVIEDGKIVEIGSPMQLMEEQGVYYKYWQSQMGL